MSQVLRSPQRNQALDQLRELILAGEFSVDQRVSELAVVEKLGISRTPVRLALTILEHEGFLQTLPRGGFIVRQFTIQDVYDAIEIRGQLEGLAARRAAERRLSTEQLAPIKAIVHKLDQVMFQEDRALFAEQYIEWNAEFHKTLMSLSGSTMLERSFAHVASLPFASPNAFAFTGGDSEEHVQVLKYGQNQHRAIFEAIESGEGARAEYLGQEHARLAMQILSNALRNPVLFDRIPGASLLDMEQPENR